MVASHLIWMVRTRGIRRRAKDDDLTFDESVEGSEWQAKGIDMGAKLADVLAFGKGRGEDGSLAATPNVDDRTGQRPQSGTKEEEA
jgi:hypothetical protein